MRSFQWRIAIPFIILIAASMAVLGFYLTDSVRDSRMESLRFHLEQEARITAEAALPALLGAEGAPDELAKKLGGEIDSRVTIITPDGTVAGDSLEDPADMESHAGRPEFAEALASGLGYSTRYSTTLGQQMMYLAVPILSDGEVLGVARVALPLTAVETTVNQVTRTIVLATVITAALAVIAAWFIARLTTRPIRELTRAAGEIAAGRLGHHIAATAPDEIGRLAGAFNNMSANLQTTMSTISEEKAKLDNILAGLADGVIMTDKDGNIVLVNRAAGRLFGFREDEAAGRPVIEMAHDHEIDEVLKRCLETSEEQSAQFESGGSRRFLRALAVPFRGRPGGVLILIQDLTELRNLQTMRREMVGNISHELRTPIAGIKAMVETLRGGAIDDKEAAGNFLGRIEDEADRLTQMVAELTQLSRIESGQAELRIEPVDLNELADEIAAQMEPLAARQQVTLAAEPAAGLPAVPADRDRIRQTITNLVHNAIKFNRPGGRVTVGTGYDDDAVTVSVADTGIGISPEDLPHVFERFYKADKARSGGGSGLGLAIAKHTVQAHGGEIRAQSREGEGSTFSFSLPRR